MSFVELRFLIFFVVFLVITCFLFKGKKPLFLQCIYAGIGCFFLHTFWLFCNYLWIGVEEQLHMVVTLSYVSSYLFLFFASYGALDSLADDGRRENRKYTWIAVAAGGGVCVVWGIRFVQTFRVHDILLGACFTLLCFISVKHLIIPDIKDGFVRTLRPYNAVLLLIVIVSSIELFFSGAEQYRQIDSVIQLIRDLAVLLLYPMASKGVRKWTLV